MKKLIKLIEPGWGSSGHYASKMIESYVSEAFPVGTPMLDTHVNNNPENQAARQGVSGDFLKARIVSESWYQAENAPAGIGGYAWAYFYETTVRDWGEDKINDMAASIFTLCLKGDTVEIDGRKGRSIEAMINAPMTSVDLVVFAGAGGLVVPQRNVTAEMLSHVPEGYEYIQKQGSSIVTAEMVDAAELLIPCPTDDQVAETLGHEIKRPFIKKFTRGFSFTPEAPSLSEISHEVRRDFRRQFPFDPENEFRTPYIVDIFADDGYVVVSERTLFRVDFTKSNDRYVFEQTGNWAEVQRRSEYSTIAEKYGEVDIMTLQEALEKNASLVTKLAEAEASVGALTNEVTTLTNERDDIQGKLKTALDLVKTSAENQAITNVIGGVEFNDEEAKEFVLSKLRKELVWEDGKLLTTGLKAAAETYVKGESSLVKAKEASPPEKEYDEYEMRFGSEHFDRLPNLGNPATGGELDASVESMTKYLEANKEQVF